MLQAELRRGEITQCVLPAESHRESVDGAVGQEQVCTSAPRRWCSTFNIQTVQRPWGQRSTTRMGRRPMRMQAQAVLWESGHVSEAMTNMGQRTYRDGNTIDA